MLVVRRKIWFHVSGLSMMQVPIKNSKGWENGLEVKVLQVWGSPEPSCDLGWDEMALAKVSPTGCAPPQVMWPHILQNLSPESLFLQRRLELHFGIWVPKGRASRRQESLKLLLALNLLVSLWLTLGRGATRTNINSEAVLIGRNPSNTHLPAPEFLSLALPLEGSNI